MRLQIHPSCQSKINGYLTGIILTWNTIIQPCLPVRQAINLISVSVFTVARPCSTCLPCFLTGPITQLLYVGMTSLFILFIFFFLVNIMLCLSWWWCMCLPYPLQTSLGCSWFILHCTPSSGCRAKIVPICLCFRWWWEEVGQGVNAPRMLAHDKDWPPLGSVGMQIECPPLVSAAPPPPQSTITGTHIHTHRHYMCTWGSSEADTFALESLLA